MMSLEFMMQNNSDPRRIFHQRLVRGTIGFGVRILRILFTGIMRKLPIQPKQPGKATIRHTKARRGRLLGKLLMSSISNGASITG